MGNRHHQLNVAATLATHLLFRDQNTATVAHNASVTDALVLTAIALVILGRTEDALAEKAITLRLIGAVVNRFGFQHFAIRILQDFFGGSQSDSNLRKRTLYL